MAVEGRRNINSHMVIDAAELFDDAGKVPLQVDSERQKVGNDQDSRGAPPNERANSLLQVRRTLLQERWFDVIVAARPGQASRNHTDRFVRGRNARPVRKDNDRRSQQLPAM